MSVSSRFEQFVASLRPLEQQSKAADRTIMSLIQQLHRVMEVEKTFTLGKVGPAGSRTKHTALRRTDMHVSDVDLGVYFLAREATQESLETLLRFTREKLLKIYPNKSPKDFTAPGRAVRVFFRGKNLHVDVVPILRDPSLDMENGGYITGHDGWRLTSITYHTDFVRRRTEKSKQIHGPVRFNRLVRLMKYWNSLQGELKQSSYFCELITAAAFDKKGVTKKWQSSLLQIFSFFCEHQFLTPIVFNDYCASRLIRLPSDHVIVLDSVDPENNLTRKWDEAKRRGYVNLLQRTYETMRQACDYEHLGNEEAAVQAWCQVFGEAFRQDHR